MELMYKKQENLDFYHVEYDLTMVTVQDMFARVRGGEMRRAQLNCTKK